MQNIRHNQGNYFEMTRKGQKMRFLEAKGQRFPVSGVREARKLCKELGVPAWNF